VKTTYSSNQGGRHIRQPKTREGTVGQGSRTHVPKYKEPEPDAVADLELAIRASLQSEQVVGLKQKGIKIGK
jgi:hypothetical protein